MKKIKSKIKPITALALIGKNNKLTPEWIINPKYEKEYMLKSGERFIKVNIIPA